MEKADPIREASESTHDATGEITRLVREHHAEVYSYAYRLTGSPTDAEDLTQHTFLLAFRRLDQLRDRAKAGGWLRTIVRNAFLKQKQRKTFTTEPLEPDSLSEPNTELPDWIDPEQLQQSLLRLPDDARVILLLFFFEDCSYMEIAEKLGLSLGTVMSRLSRAKERLRKELTISNNLIVRQKP